MFTDVQVNRLVELVRLNESKLFPNSLNKWNRSLSRQAWANIAFVFNSEFPEEMKTAEQIRIKWKNMRQRAKETGQLHPLMQPQTQRRHSSCEVQSYSSKPLDETLAHVMSVFSNAISSNSENDSDLKRERRPSVMSDSPSDKSERPSSSLNFGIESVILSGRPRSASMLPALETGFKITRPTIITTGPNNLPSSPQLLNGKRRTDWETESTPPKRSTESLERELMEEKVKNARKLGSILDEAITFLRSLNRKIIE